MNNPKTGPNFNCSCKSCSALAPRYGLLWYCRNCSLMVTEDFRFFHGLNQRLALQSWIKTWTHPYTLAKYFPSLTVLTRKLLWADKHLNQLTISLLERASKLWLQICAWSRGGLFSAASWSADSPRACWAVDAALWFSWALDPGACTSFPKTTKGNCQDSCEG